MKAIPILLLLWPSIISAQVSEEFTDGNFTNHPKWYGDTALWRVVDGRLNSNFTTVNHTFQYFYQLSTKSKRVESTEWEFWIKTGPTSRNNFIRMFLCSQDSVLRYDKPNKGYFLQIGNTPDNVALYKKDSLQYSQLISSREDITDHAELKIKVTCDDQHRWHLYTDATGGGYVLEGTAIDSTFIHSSYFNIVVFQKGKSANHSHWLDNIYIKSFTSNTTTPKLTKTLVINEIYADPTPSHGLPEAEYIELLNVSNYPVNLNGWRLCDRTRCADIPSVTLLPDSLLILCRIADTAAFYSYGHVVGLSHFISLNNGGDDLYLKNATGKIVQIVQYTKDSYNDEEKAKGGWSLEIQHPAYPCLTEGNWAASNITTGGSPGKANVITESQKPFLDLEYVTVIDSIHLIAQFNAILDSQLINEAAFTLNGQPIVNIKRNNKSLTQLNILLSEPLYKKKIYTFRVQGLTSCGLVTGVQNEIRFGVPEAAVPKDVVINEILFNPHDGSEDFVELYNTSNKIIDLQTLFLADMDNGMIDKLYSVSTGSYYLLPESYVAITTNKKELLQQYICKHPNSLVETLKMPSYPNRSGEVVLVDVHETIIDKMDYDEHNHSPFFHNEEGVSLERVNPLAPSTEVSNWASASTVSGYATPGYQNSQFVANQPSANVFKVIPEVFSPDADGMDDLAFLNYILPSGYAATIQVYNEYGRLVRHLKSNVSLNTKGKIPWNGKDDNGQLLPTGIYILYVELYHPSGAVNSYKLPVVLVQIR